VKLAGRPSSYTDDIAREICERIANGESLRRICLDEHMPSRITVHAWLLDDRYAEFLTKYTRARELQAENFADEMTDIADFGEVDKDHINRDRLRIETRKWIASKLKPKKYGDRVELEHSGSIGNISKEQRDAAVAAAIKADS